MESYPSALQALTPSERISPIRPILLFANSNPSLAKQLTSACATQNSSLETSLILSSIEFEPTGSMTQEREGEVSVQADESYCFGQSKPTPDLVIEIVFTSGGPSKLPRYRALGVPEVWFWQDGVFSLYRLRDRGYEKINRSEIPELSALDIELLTRCVLMAQTYRLEAANQFRKALSA